MEKKTIIKAVISALILFAAFAGLSGIGGKAVTYRPLKADGEQLTRDDIEYLDVDAPEATSSDGTVTAEDWSSVYPYISATMWSNSDNSYVTSYLEQDPYLVNIYEGYGFAKDYGSARGHEYCLEDVSKTQRPHATANCLTCKTPNFAKLVQDMGVEVYSMDFEEVLAMMNEDISCYTCHENEAGNEGQISISHTYVKKALGDDLQGIDPATVSCGQCHIEYYFWPETKETSMPYTSVEEMTPSAILAYYDSIDFADWTQESTGTRLLKAQHPEFETFLQGKHASMLNCADCHMAMVQEEDGTVYHSHYLESPLENETILQKCTECHGDRNMVSYVREIQSEITERETEVGNKLSDMKDALAAAVADGSKSEEELDRIRKLHREAQWYFDYCYVENSEGAHNSALSKECLGIAESKIKEAMELLAA